VISVPTATKRPRPWTGGAIFAPEKIGPAVPAPADFDAFWQTKLKELAAIPMNPVVEKASIDDVKFNGGVPYYKVTLDNIWNTHIQGQLARPVKGDKFPAILFLQAAGVYPLQKEMVVRPAKKGFLILNIQAHDIPVDESPEFYNKLKATTLKDYTSIGIESRETSYFLRMLLGCVRAAEYLTSRPDWDRKTLIVCGGSQGGLQSFATAALFSKVTALVCDVPAAGDASAVLAKPPRGLGWPACYFPPRPDDPDGAKARATLSYFDPIYFAAQIHCPANVAVGLLDEVARPASVAAIYNAIPGTSKELMIFPLFDHSASGAAPIWWARLDDWKAAAKEGSALPPAIIPPATSFSTIIQASTPTPAPH
jgi:cephalosporin-C deacetylase